MKKRYSKPELCYESFELAANIASCSVITLETLATTSVTTANDMDCEDYDYDPNGPCYQVSVSGS